MSNDISDRDKKDWQEFVSSKKKRYIIPKPGKNGALTAKSQNGTTFVMTGIFPELGGGGGLNLGKGKLKALIVSFGGRVTSSVSGKTNILVVGKNPGYSKVSKARRQPNCKLMSLKDNIYYADDYIKEILFTTKSIAMVGLSDKENRPSNFAAKYLKKRGYKIIPVNPVTDKKTILGEKVYKTISELEFIPDMVDLFVKKEKILMFVKEAIKIKTKTIWLQLGLIDKESEKIANTANINFIMNRCPKIEYAKFSGELGWAGINSNVISNKRNLLKNV